MSKVSEQEVFERLQSVMDSEEMQDFMAETVQQTLCMAANHPVVLGTEDQGQRGTLLANVVSNVYARSLYGALSYISTKPRSDKSQEEFCHDIVFSAMRRMVRDDAELNVRLTSVLHDRSTN